MAFLFSSTTKNYNLALQDWESGKESPSDERSAKVFALFEETLYEEDSAEGDKAEAGALLSATTPRSIEADGSTSARSTASTVGGIAVVPVQMIVSFLQATFTLAQFSPETYVLALVYLNRVIAATKWPVQKSNWKLLLLTTVMLAQKIWDDKSLSNVDFPVIWRRVNPRAKKAKSKFSIRDMNRLERRLLEILHYNVTVGGGLYGRYYFELRTMAAESLPASPRKHMAPLKPSEAKSIEAKTSASRDLLLEVRRRLARTRARGATDGTMSPMTGTPDELPRSPFASTGHITDSDRHTRKAPDSARRATDLEEATRTKGGRAVIS